MVTITVNTRTTSWYQVSPLGLDDTELSTHLALMADYEWRRHHGHRTIVVTAADDSGQIRHVTRGPDLPPCPHRGFVR